MTNRSPFMATVPKGPFWLSTPLQVTVAPAVGADAANTTVAPFLYSPSDLAAWLNLTDPPVTNTNKLCPGTGMSLRKSRNLVTGVGVGAGVGVGRGRGVKVGAGVGAAVGVGARVGMGTIVGQDVGVGIGTVLVGTG